MILQILGAFGIGLLGAIVVTIVLRLMVPRKEEEEKDPCKLHDWVLNEHDKYICMRCNFRSG